MILESVRRGSPLRAAQLSTNRVLCVQDRRRLQSRVEAVETVGCEACDCREGGALRGVCECSCLQSLGSPIWWALWSQNAAPVPPRCRTRGHGLGVHAGLLLDPLPPHRKVLCAQNPADKTQRTPDDWPLRTYEGPFVPLRGQQMPSPRPLDHSHPCNPLLAASVLLVGDVDTRWALLSGVPRS